MATHIMEAIRQNGKTFGYRPNKWTGKKLHNQFGSSSTNRPVRQWQHNNIADLVQNRTPFKKCVLDSKKPDRDMVRICHDWRPAPNAPPPAPVFYGEVSNVVWAKVAHEDSFYKRNRQNWYRR